jgi:hypothetical protein
LDFHHYMVFQRYQGTKAKYIHVHICMTVQPQKYVATRAWNTSVLYVRAPRVCFVYTRSHNSVKEEIETQ